MAEQLDLDTLRKAVAGTAAAFRSRTTLQPAGGEGDKVFPPTYAGAVYAVEQRRLPDREEPVTCVLLDSVQSQANRMEEALQEAVDRERITLPVIEVDFSGEDLIDPVDRVTSLQAPHRVADAILRDSLLDGVSFRQSEVGRRVDRVSLQNATPLFDLCPTALVLGMWDSTGPKGGLGAKFARAMVSEIVGIDATFGTKTSSRIDPTQIQKSAGPVYRAKEGGWTLDPENAVDEMKKGEPTGKKILFARNSKKKDVAHDPAEEKFADQGRPSVVNHGNVTPDIDYRRDKNRNLIKDDNDKPIPVGGVTIASAEQMTVLSLPQLRRLRFPLDGEGWKASREQYERDDAARAVLAALALCGAALAAEKGCDLRSRCHLWPDFVPTWEILDTPGAEPRKATLNAEAAINLLHEAVAAAKEAGLPWREEPLMLKPSEQLVALVRKSQELAAAEGESEGGDGEGAE